MRYASKAWAAKIAKLNSPRIAIEASIIAESLVDSMVTGTRPPPRGRELGLRYSLA